MISRIGLFSTASAAYYWPKYSWNSEGYHNCECHRVTFETPYGTEDSCLDKYKSEGGIAGDVCGTKYPTEPEPEIPTPDVGERLISKGVDFPPKYQPEQSQTCHDLIHYVNKGKTVTEGGIITLSDILVHKADKSTISCEMYGYMRPLCEPRKACLVLSYEAPSVNTTTVEEVTPEGEGDEDDVSSISVQEVSEPEADTIGSASISNVRPPFKGISASTSDGSASISNVRPPFKGISASTSDGSASISNVRPPFKGISASTSDGDSPYYFYWPKYSWNSEGYHNCECHRVTFETPYGTENSCLDAYRSTEGVSGDICGTKYPTEPEPEIPTPDVGERLISKGVESGPKYQPEQSKTCHDLIHYVNKQRSERETKLTITNVLVHKADKSTISCQMYGYVRPLCEPRKACLVLSYQAPHVMETYNAITTDVVENDNDAIAPEGVEDDNDAITTEGVEDDNDAIAPEGVEDDNNAITTEGVEDDNDAIAPEGGDDNDSESDEEETPEGDDNDSESDEEETPEIPEGSALDANDEDQEHSYIDVSESVSFGLIGLLFMAMY